MYGKGKASLKFCFICADIWNMDISEFLSVAKVVLSDKRVIGTAIVVFLCMDFGTFVAHYTRKPLKQKPRQKQKSKSTTATPASDNENAGTSSGGNESEQAAGTPAK